MPRQKHIIDPERVRVCPLLNIYEASWFLGISDDSFRKILKTDRGRTIINGVLLDGFERQLRFKKENLIRYIESLPDVA